MMNGSEPVAMSEKKRENKVIGFNVRMLDDKSYLLRTSNKSYEHEKEYSYEDRDSLAKGIKEILGMVGDKMKKNDDALDRESEKE